MVDIMNLVMERTASVPSTPSKMKDSSEFLKKRRKVNRKLRKKVKAEVKRVHKNR
jgi:hypothetical protein